MARQVTAMLSVIGFLISPARAIAGDLGTPSKPPAKQVRSDLHKGAKYFESSQDERAKVTAALDCSEATLEAQPDVTVLQPDQRAALHNDQEPVTQILTKAGEDGRLVAGARVQLVRR
ncbi:hypothetical protein XA1314C_30230 [Xanthomonas arboricola]|uniref:Uncharacterized protein n=1 Tax=Xanthomonas arboricola TaxID=56448 RepID=A0AAU9I2R1_9XANT|nr:hypothetical protein XA1314C_30230 [Xanthomonas arboricola]CAE6807722.1 hypothetical protein XA1314C_30230 [Xanthomonas arboricola]